MSINGTPCDSDCTVISHYMQCSIATWAQFNVILTHFLLGNDQIGSRTVDYIVANGLSRWQFCLF